MAETPELIAHRGAPRERLENTRTSFAAALAHGADGVELDVHFTRDHVPVVHHDATLGAAVRQYAGARIDALDAAVVARVELVPGETIPTLREVCDLVAGRATLYVEIKGAAGDAELGVVHALLRRAPARSRSAHALHSFDHDVARRSAALAREVPTGILREGERDDPVGALRRVGARDLWQHWSEIDAALVDTVHGVVPVLDLLRFLRVDAYRLAVPARTGSSRCTSSAA